MNLLQQSRPIEILLVEDNNNDVLLTQEGFREAKLVVNLHHVEHGGKCMEFLRNEGQYADAPKPDLILLDLNLPVMDGREVLRAIVDDSQLSHIPVVILTTSSDDEDILRMYKHRCSSYIVKPVDFEKFVNLIREFGHYWFTVVVLPSQT